VDSAQQPPDERPGEPAPLHPEQLHETVSGELLSTHEIGNRTYVVAQVDPLDVDGVRTVAVGTVMWLVAFVLLLPFYGRLQSEDKVWWLWTCLAGFGLGLLGLDYCRRRRRARQARIAASPPG
jgi:hypothetical protein